MRRLVLVVMVLSSGVLCKAQTGYVLTQKDKENHILSIDQPKITAVHDSVVRGRSIYKIASIRVKLSNLSNDTLKYINMSCSWGDIYITNDNDVSIFTNWPCDKNFPDIVEIAPHHSLKLNIPVALRNNKKGGVFKFKIGMSLQKLNNESYGRIRSAFEEMLIDGRRFNKESYLWSNEVFLVGR